MELKDVYVGQLVRVVDAVPAKGFNWYTFSVDGERHPSAKLTAADVDFIRTNYTPKHPTKGAKALTKQFGISLRSLYYILDGTNWGGDYSSQRMVI